MLRLFKKAWATQGNGDVDTSGPNLKRNRSSDTVDLDAMDVDSHVAEEPHPKRRKLAPAVTNIPHYCGNRDIEVLEAAKQRDSEPDQTCQATAYPAVAIAPFYDEKGLLCVH
jgi:hypothetical protein